MSEPLAAPFAALCNALRGLQDEAGALATVHDAMDEFNQVFGAFQNATALHASCLAFPAPSAGKLVPPKAIAKPSTMKPLSTDSDSMRKRDARAKARGSRSSGASDASPSSVGGGGHGTGRRGSGGESGAVAGRGASSRGRGEAQARGRGGGRGRGSGSGRGGGAVDASKKRALTKSRAAAAAAALKRPARPDTAPWKWDNNIRDQIPRKYQSTTELAKMENLLIYLKNRQTGVTIADLVKHSGLAVIRCKEILQTLTKVNLITRRQESAGFVYTFGGSSP